MYVKNVSQILKANTPQSSRLFEGSVITGKVLSNDNGKGAIKLYDGTIIPAIFISENDIEQEKQLKFVVQNFDGENFVLKVANDTDEAKSQKSFFTIIRDMNIPFEEGKNIILDLLKFNLPATNENINTIYKNLSFLKDLQKMSDADIIHFLKQALNSEISENSKEFIFTKELFQNLKTIDRSFLTFMLENDIPHTLENMAKAQDFMSNKFFLNSFIDNIKNIMSSVSAEDEAALNRYVNLLNENSDNTKKNASNVSNMNANANITKAGIPIITASNTEILLKNSIADKLSKEFPFSKLNLNEVLSQGLQAMREQASIIGSKEGAMFQRLLDDYDILKNPQNFINTKQPEAEKLLLGTLTYKLASSQGKIDKNMILSSFEEVFNMLNENINKSDGNPQPIEINPTWTSRTFEKGITNTVLTSSEKQLMNDLLKNLERSIKGDNAPAELREALCIIKDNKDIFSFSSSKVYNSLLEEFDTIKNPQNFKNTNTSKTEELLLNALKNNISTNNNTIDKTTVLKSFEQALSVFNDSIDISSISSTDLFKKLAESADLNKTPTVLMKGNPSDTEKLLIDALLKNITKNATGPEKHITVASFEEALNVFRENKDLFSFGPSGTYQKLLDNFDMFKQISPNYSLYFFNLYEGSNIFKNNIIIKNKYKGSKHIDINDVKAYITVDTKNLGIVEGNLYKKNHDISIYFSVPENHVTLFKNNIRILKNTLKEYGYNFVNLSVEAKNENKILPFLDFYNESVLKELDVKV